jgi:5-methylcytosine-specific restriction enzyme A
MPTRASVHRGQPKRPSRSDEQRGTSAKRGYGHKWQVARRAFLREHPTCMECELSGIVTASTVVDHIVPHRGDEELFWDRSNWQSLCETHHNIKTARGE